MNTNYHNNENNLIASLQQKISYLQQENSQLQDQVQEISNLLQLNKQAMRLMTQQMTENKGVVIVLRTLQEENSMLQQNIESLIFERNEAQNQVLLGQQLTEAAHKHESELLVELEERISDLMKQLNEKQIAECQKEKLCYNYDENTGIMIKYRDVVSPDKVVMQLHDEIQLLSVQLCSYKQRVDNQKSKIQDLHCLNIKLTTEILKLRSTVFSHHGKQLIMQSQEIDLNTIKKFQTKILQKMNISDECTSSSEDNSSPSISPLPIKNEQVHKQKTFELPKLDLTKAKQIQEINAKRQIQHMHIKVNKEQNIPGTITKQLKTFNQPINRLENQLDNARRSLNKEMMSNKTLQIQNDNLSRQNEELDARQEVLIRSNISYEAKWRKIHNQYSFLQQFYIGKKDQKLNLSQHNGSFSYICMGKSEQLDEQSYNQSFYQNLERRLDESHMQNLIDSIEEAQLPLNPKHQQNNYYQYYVPTNIQDCKRFLIQYAKEMYMGIQYKMGQLDQLNSLNKHKRALSDLIDYQRVGFTQYAYQDFKFDELLNDNLNGGTSMDIIELS